MSKTVLSLAPLSAELVKLLIQQTPDVPDFEVIAGHEMSNEEIKKAISGVDMVLGDYTFSKKITAEMVSAAPKLKFIQQPSVGYQHIDVEACTAKGIKVANTAGANTISVAEYTIASGLCLLKNMFHAHTSTKAGGWEQMNIKPCGAYGQSLGHRRVWTHRPGGCPKAQTIRVEQAFILRHISSGGGHRSATRC